MAHDRAGHVRRSSTPEPFIAGDADVPIRYTHGAVPAKIVGSITAEEAERRALGKCARILRSDAARAEWKAKKLASDLAYARRQVA